MENRRRIRVTIDVIVTNDNAEVEVDREVPFDEIKDGIIIQQSDVIDGYELTTDVACCCNTSNFFIKDATIVSKEYVD